MNINGKPFPITLELHDIITRLRSAGAKHTYVVGGSVRDYIMGQAINDYDMEIYGLTNEQISKAVEGLGAISYVGEKFKVLKLRHSSGREYDLALPRREIKIGPLHTDFYVSEDPFMDPLQASERRDYTINSIMYDPVEDILIDPYNGVHDIALKVLRPTSAKFEEDAPVRILRGMQFAGRFGFKLQSRYSSYMSNLTRYAFTASRERVWGEWYKWAAKSKYPSFGIEFLLDAGWLYLYPEIYNLIGCEQDPRHHPEGDAFIHTLICTDRMVDRCEAFGIKEDTDERAMLVFTALYHDVAKPPTTVREKDGSITSNGHDQLGAKMIPAAMEKLGRVNPDQKKADHMVEAIQILTANHMRHLSLKNPSKHNVRRLAADVGNLRHLSHIVWADNSARPPHQIGLPPQMEAIMKIASEIEIEDKKPVRILNGSMLIELGLKPGPTFKKLIEAAYQAQLDGVFEDEAGALVWIKKEISAT